MAGTALIIGPTGGFGAACMNSLHAYGWRLRALARDPDAGRAMFPHIPKANWTAGNAVNKRDVMKAGRGVDVIIHAANPPGYRDWGGLGQPMLSSVIDSAKDLGARVVFPASMYNFGPDAGPLIDETTPQYPVTQKGAIRAAMEARLQRATEEEGIRVLVLRMGEFFGPYAPASWLHQVMIKKGHRIRSIRYPGRYDAGHAWAYLPDVGETVARLLKRQDEFDPYTVFHFGGHYFERGVEMAEAVRRIAGLKDTPIKGMPWPLIRLAEGFVPLFEELVEHRYLWSKSMQLDNTKLVNFLGEEPHTPLDDALRETLVALECLPVGALPAAAPDPLEPPTS